MMTSLKPDEETTYSLLNVVSSDEKFKKRLDELVQHRQELEAAEASIVTQSKALEQQKADVERTVAEQKTVLLAAQAAHDKAAKEAADRIALAQGQASELLTLEADLKEREKGLAVREKTAAEATRTLKEEFERFEQEKQEVQKLKESLVRKHAKLSEVLSE